MLNMLFEYVGCKKCDFNVVWVNFIREYFLLLYILNFNSCIRRISNELPHIILAIINALQLLPTKPCYM